MVLIDFDYAGVRAILVVAIVDVHDVIIAKVVAMVLVLVLVALHVRVRVMVVVIVRMNVSNRSPGSRYRTAEQ